MDDDSLNFCTSCGAPLRESDTFCTSCGAGVGNKEQPQAQNRIVYPKSGKLLVVVILSAVWAVIAVLLGIYVISAADTIVSNLGPDTLNTFMNLGYGPDDIANMITIIGAVILASGVFAAVTAVLSFLKKFYFIALIACIISAVLGLSLLIGLVGFIVAFLIHSSKHEFDGVN